MLINLEINNEHVNESSEISTLNIFDHYKSEPTTNIPLRPNDDKEGPPGRDGRVHQPDDGAITDHPGHDGEHSVTLVGDQNQSEGNVGSPIEVPVIQNELPSVTGELGPRRSQRFSKLPTKLNEFVLDTKVKYGLNRYANHYVLILENYSFVSNFNKCSEPSSYEEALKEVNCVNAKNDEMHA
ncbi:hypothetical protein Tco_0055489, partial [Tanacetum coccineum]